MKKTMSFLLALVMVLSLFAGCGGETAAETTLAAEEPVAMETMAAPATELATEPTTVPTLSPEEILYDSLTDRQRQAVDLGLVELEQLADLERIVTVGEAAAMLQKAYVHRTGVESKTLNEMMTEPDYSERNADRGWVLPIPGVADLELTHGAKYKNYSQWVKYLDDMNTSMNVWSQFDDRLGITGISWHDMEEDDSLFDSSVFGRNVFAADIDDYFLSMGEDSVYGPYRPASYTSVVNYGLIVYDSTNGKRYFTLEAVDGKEYYNYTEELTVADAAEYALIYYHYPNPMEYPEFVAPEEVGIYNPDIITEEMLSKETTLPEPTCQNLPSGWRGVVMDDMDFLHVNHHLDFEVYDYEIQLLKEAGFNYIGLNLDFSYLQDYLLFGNRYESDTKTYKSIIRKEDKGKLSVQRLEELDRVLALCMEKDIHLNLRATGLPNYNSVNEQEWRVKDTKGLDQSLAAMWQAIARRYADIPNTYLSFTVFSGDEVTKPKDEILLPSIDAIRMESPERCIIAEIFHEGMVASTYAEKEVALSYRMGKNTSDVFYLGDYFSRSRGANWWTAKGSAFVEQFTWPYNAEVDAEALLTMGKGETCRSVMDAAQAYGVGFMLSEFGVSYAPLTSVNVYPRARYAGEHYFAMITDITSTMEELGYGWCFAHWYSPYGIAFCLPVVEDAVYEQVEDYPYYIDQGMFGLFQKINGVS